MNLHINTWVHFRMPILPSPALALLWIFHSISRDELCHTRFSVPCEISFSQIFWGGFHSLIKSNCLVHITACNTISVFLIKMSLGLSTWIFSFSFWKTGAITWKDLSWLMFTCWKLLGDWVAPFQNKVLSGTCATFYALSYQQCKKKNPISFHNFEGECSSLITIGIRFFCQIAELFVCKSMLLWPYLVIINQATWFVMASRLDIWGVFARNAQVRSRCPCYMTPNNSLSMWLVCSL